MQAFGVRDALETELAEIEARGLRRRLQTFEDGLDFSSNDYLGFASERTCVDALRGAGASRLITGHHQAHQDIEQRLAAYVGLPAGLLFSSGYAANLGTLTALLGPEDEVFSDALNHASLIDGCRLSRARVQVYPHADPKALSELLARSKARRRLVVTDAVFSMDGDAAPLKELRPVCDQHGAWLMVDEAHSLGLLGPHGAGLCRALSVVPDVLVGTLGKSFGVMGAFIAGDDALREILLHHARSFVFSTGVSPLITSALAEVLPRVIAADEARAVALERARQLRQGLRDRGYDVPNGVAAIVPVLLGTEAKALAFADRLRGQGIIAHAIRPPTVPVGTCRVRLTTSARQTAENIETLLEATR